MLKIQYTPSGKTVISILWKKLFTELITDLKQILIFVPVKVLKSMKFTAVNGFYFWFYYFGGFTGAER